MKPTDPDYAAMLKRLPVLRRYEGLVRGRLHQFAMRRPGTRGDTLDRIVTYFRDNVRNVGPINRAFLKRMVTFADLVIEGEPPAEAARIACRTHPDPYVDLGLPTSRREGGTREHE